MAAAGAVLALAPEWFLGQHVVGAVLLGLYALSFLLVGLLVAAVAWAMKP